MRPKQDDPPKRHPRQEVPSTGMGAASAMDALIKRRVPQPGNGIAQSPIPKKH